MSGDRAERRKRYAAAMDDVTGGCCPVDLIDAVMAVADAELTELRAQVANLRVMYDAVSAREHDLIIERDELAGEVAELRAEYNATEASARYLSQERDALACQLTRVRAVLENASVSGRSALEYRGLVTSALLGEQKTDL